MKLVIVVFFIVVVVFGADLPGSKDPAGMKRYEGSEIVGYRKAKFDEYLLPLGRQLTYTPLAFEKSQKVEGLISRYTYLAPLGRTPAEVMQNYKLEFTRLGLLKMYEKGATDQGWFGPTFGDIENEDDLGQILSYNESQERLLVGRSKDARPTYYEIFVTSYKDGIIPPRLANQVKKDRTMAEIIVIAPQKLEQKMVFVDRADPSNSSPTSAADSVQSDPVPQKRCLPPHPGSVDFEAVPAGGALSAVHIFFGRFCSSCSATYEILS